LATTSHSGGEIDRLYLRAVGLGGPHSFFQLLNLSTVIKVKFFRADQYFTLEQAIYHRKIRTAFLGDTDSLYVINPVFSIYISQLVGRLLFHFFCFVKSFFIVHDVPSPW
jgi:hypothetical protein